MSSAFKLIVRQTPNFIENDVYLYVDNLWALYLIDYWYLLHQQEMFGGEAARSY